MCGSSPCRSFSARSRQRPRQHALGRRLPGPEPRKPIRLCRQMEHLAQQDDLAVTGSGLGSLDRPSVQARPNRKEHLGLLQTQSGHRQDRIAMRAVAGWQEGDNLPSVPSHTMNQFSDRENARRQYRLARSRGLMTTTAAKAASQYQSRQYYQTQEFVGRPYQHGRSPRATTRYRIQYRRHQRQHSPSRPRLVCCWCSLSVSCLLSVVPLLSFFFFSPCLRVSASPCLPFLQAIAWFVYRSMGPHG